MNILKFIFWFFVCELIYFVKINSKQIWFSYNLYGDFSQTGSSLNYGNKSSSITSDFLDLISLEVFELDVLNLTEGSGIIGIRLDGED